MMNKIVTVIVIVFTLALNLNAQQQGQFSQYMLNYYIVNPAVSGTEDYIDFKAGYRLQWVGLENAPRNYYLSAHAPINKLHGSHNIKRANKRKIEHHSIGGMLNGQKAGSLSRTAVYGSYAYHLPIDSKHFLSIGIMAGALQYSLISSYGVNQQADDPAISNFNVIKPDASIGAWFYSHDYFAGISTAQIFNNKINTTVGHGFNATLNRHVYFAGGYGISMNNYFKVIPSTLIKYSNKVLQADINCKLKYQGNYWLGGSYRHNDALVIMAGCLIARQVDFGVSYDIITSKLRNYTASTYEFVLGYRFHFNEGIINPSDFW